MTSVARPGASIDDVGCPSDEDLACHASGHGREDVAAHVAGCAACAGVAAALRGLAQPATATTVAAPRGFVAPAGDHPGPGDLVDRYVVLRQLGQGGMGVVVLAYDPVLDRAVAMKLMRADRASPVLAARLEREARSLARLTHPNVVRVFDAGTWAGRVFMAMEHVEGESVRAWLRSGPRATTEILRVFVEAGRGLVATHDAGFVHRDVKPGNILLASDGTARLADFGLVGGEAFHDGDTTSPVPASTPELVSACEHLTRPDSAMGTPGYMSPEQRAAGTVGTAADQYGFCASLWEALFGVLPVPDQPAAPEPPGERRVPPWLREVIARGLRSTPGARWPSMRALLAALERDPVAARRRALVRAGAAVVIVGLVAASAVALLRDPSDAPDRRCRGLDAELAGVWDPARAVALERAFLAGGSPRAAPTYARVAGQLDAYARRWVVARTDACEATHVRGVQSAAVLDVRMACLERRLRDVDALVDVLVDGVEPATLDQAVPAVGRLAPLDECADVTSLQVIEPPPADPAARATIARARRAVADARALERTGVYGRGLALARDAVTRAHASGYAPVIAEALHLRGSLEDRAGDARGAERTLEEALVAAGRARDDGRAAAIWADLVYVVGGPLGRPADALRLRPGAEAALARAGGGPRAEAALWLALAMTHYTHGDLASARQAQERAIALLERAHGRDHADLAAALGTLGNILLALAAHDEARAAHERALAIAEAALGPEHPNVAATLTNLGLVLHAQRRLDEARAAHERALAIHERALGPSHPVVAATLTNLGLVLQEEGKPAEARALHERALAIREQVLGPAHPDVAVSLNNLGAAAFAAGHPAEARALHERALAIRERALGADHLEVGTSLYNLGDALAALGDHRRALSLYVRALDVWRGALGPDHPHVALALAAVERERRARR